MTRKDARILLEILRDWISSSDEDVTDEIDALGVAIKALKQPEQKKGKWIVTGMFDDFLKCSCCGYKKPWNEDTFNFCPFCGAKMEGE